MDNQKNNADFLLRFLAILLDKLLFLVLWALPGIFLFKKAVIVSLSMFSPEPMMNFALYLVIWVFLSGIIGLIYAVYFSAKFGGTLGKLFFGLKILKQESDNYIDFKTAFYRASAGYAFSSVFFGLGFWQIVRNPLNLGWHDELFGTRVVRTGNYVGGVLVLLGLLALVTVLGFYVYSFTQNIPF